MNDVANKSMAPLSVDEVVQVTHKCRVPPFSHKVIHRSVSLVLQGYRMNLMTHGLEKRSPSLPLGIDVQSAYAMLSMGSNRVAVVLRNNTRNWIEIGKGTPVTRMVAANQVPRVIDTISADKDKLQPTLMEAERQDLLLNKLDLSGLEAWPAEEAEKAHGLLCEYQDIFSLEKHDMGHTKATKHKIVLKDPNTPGAFSTDPASSIGQGKRTFKINARCWSSPTEQQPLVQCCCSGLEEGRITPVLHQF